MPRERRVVVVGEDILCQAVLVRLLADFRSDLAVSRAYVEGGSGNVRSSVPRYLNACRVLPHIVLADLDRMQCAPSALRAWGVAAAPPPLLFRFAVREVASWLLADARGLASFVRVPLARVEKHPERITHPKQALVNLARVSRSRELRDELVPADGSRMPIGPLYNERMLAFVRDHWDVANAASAAPSLQRLLSRLRTFAV